MVFYKLCANKLMVHNADSYKSEFKIYRYKLYIQEVLDNKHNFFSFFCTFFCLFVSKKTTHTGSTSHIESIGLKVHSEHKYSDLFVLHEVFDPTKALT